ncbi:Restriction endonuclease [Sphingomonas antarctica]|uniref:hypothetical protein n=1 Tax=Sphingomonas antarctica TaxID=2040274 RepID=UPI0039E824BD
MDDRERAEILEAALAQLLQPLKNIPFSTVVRSLAKHSIIPINKDDPHDADLIARLSSAAASCGEAVRNKPILRPRPNEVGNDIEPYVMRGVIDAGLHCVRPATAGGGLKATGYPDIIVWDAAERPTYLECKIFSADTANTSMRSFYLSPSDDFKVVHDARHLLMAFQMEATATPNSRNSEYRAVSFKLVDLHDLLCDVKYEFNSDNRRLYGKQMVLAQGPV